MNKSALQANKNKREIEQVCFESCNPKKKKNDEQIHSERMPVEQKGILIIAFKNFAHLDCP